MRFVASPLMVAVALGMLSPAVLDAEDDSQEDCSQLPEDGAEDTAAPVADPTE